MSDSNGQLGSAFFQGMTPWMRWVLIMGPATVIALYLVWQNTAERSLIFRDLQTQQQAQNASITALSTSFSVFSAAHAADTQRTVSILRQLCVNTATTADQRRKCAE